MQLLILLAFLLVASVGCSHRAPPVASALGLDEQSKLLDDAKTAVLDALVDPTDVIWGDAQVVRKPDGERRSDLGDFVCGEVNAKNSFGGYTGSTPYLFVPAWVGKPVHEARPLYIGNNAAGTASLSSGAVANSVIKSMCVGGTF